MAYYYKCARIGLLVRPHSSFHSLYLPLFLVFTLFFLYPAHAAMESSDTTATTIASSSPSSRSVSPSSSSSPPPAPTTPPPPQQPVVVSPCAACKILRRRCAEKCVLAPYFPPNDPIKFTTAHRVFGASNIIKFLQVKLIMINDFFLTN